MSPLASYRRLLELAGPAYVAVAFTARLPLSMGQLGTLLLVSSASDSYATGGLSAGALAVANAVGAPLAGALADRRGQRPVVLAQSLAGAVALVLLVLAARQGAGDALLVGAAALAGFLLPQAGPLSRGRWRPMLGHDPHRGRLLDTAFSYEGAADEGAFVLGPALVGLLVALVSPSGAVLAAAAVLLVCGSAFALHPTAVRAAPRPDGPLVGLEPARAGRPAVLTPFFAGLLLALTCVGVLFGATQTGTTVLASAVGEPGLAGLVHGLLGVGSVLAGLGTALLPAWLRHERRMLITAVALLLLSTPLLGVEGLPGLVLVVLGLGFAVAPYMISVFTLGERTLPPGRSSLGLSLLGSAVNVGYAVGAGLAGRLADAVSPGRAHTAAFAVTVTATALAVLLALLLQRPARRAAGSTGGAVSAAQPAHPLLDVVGGAGQGR